MSQTQIEQMPTVSTAPDSFENDKNDVDLVNRDPNSLNDHVKLNFDDVLAEPDGYFSDDCVWINSFKCFMASRRCLYRVLSYVCGLPLAIYWGFQFAFITFTHVWYITPCLKCFALQCDYLQRFFLACVECCGKPLFSVAGSYMRSTVI